MTVLVIKALQKLDLRPTEWGIGNKGKRRAQKENRTGELVGDGGTGEQVNREQGTQRKHGKTGGMKWNIGNSSNKFVEQKDRGT